MSRQIWAVTIFGLSGLLQQTQAAVTATDATFNYAAALASNNPSPPVIQEQSAAGFGSVSAMATGSLGTASAFQTVSPLSNGVKIDFNLISDTNQTTSPVRGQSSGRGTVTIDQAATVRLTVDFMPTVSGQDAGLSVAVNSPGSTSGGLLVAFSATTNSGVFEYFFNPGIIEFRTDAFSGQTGIDAVGSMRLTVLPDPIVSLTASDATGASSFASGLHWSDSAAPSAGKDYSVGGGLTLRTPAGTGSATFGGKSLTIGSNSASAASFVLENATGSTVTVNNLTLNNGTVTNGGNNGTAATNVTLSGNAVTLGTGGGTLDSGGANRSLTVNNVIGGAGRLTVRGGGTVALTQDNTYTGGTTVQNGTLTVKYKSNAASAATPLLTGTGADLHDGRIVFDYTAGVSPAATIRSILAASFKDSATPGVMDTGTLRSTTASAARGLGYKDNNAGGLTVMATLFGDADLDGGVSINDFNALAGNFGAATGKVWIDGDFDYDGGVSINDFNLLAAGFGQSLPASSQLWPGLLAFAAANDDLAAFEAVTGVPEPALLAVVTTAGIAGLRQRRVRLTIR